MDYDKAKSLWLDTFRTRFIPSGSPHPTKTEIY